MRRRPRVGRCFASERKAPTFGHARLKLPPSALYREGKSRAGKFRILGEERSCVDRSSWTETWLAFRYDSPAVRGVPLLWRLQVRLGGELVPSPVRAPVSRDPACDATQG